MAGPTSPGVKRPAKEVTLTFTQKDGEGSASYYPSFFSEPTASSEDISTVVATPLSKPDSVPTVLTHGILGWIRGRAFAYSARTVCIFGRHHTGGAFKANCLPVRFDDYGLPNDGQPRRRTQDARWCVVPLYRHEALRVVSFMSSPFVVTVTMFERGKLSDEFLDSLLEELQLVKPKAEGEAQVCPFLLRWPMFLLLTLYLAMRTHSVMWTTPSA